MSERRAWRVAVVAVALLLGTGLAPTPASAVDLNAIWPDLGLPGFKFTPFLSERIEYESNVFQVPSRSQDDVIFKTIPGFVLELPVGRHKFDLGFRTEILRYADLGDQNTEHYFVLGNILLDFPGGLKFRLKEDFARTSDPPGTELTGRISSNTNILAPSVEYGFTQRFALGLDYVWTTVNFDSDSGVTQLDRNEHLIGLTGFYRVQPKTDLLLSFAYGTKNFDGNSGVPGVDRDVDRFLVLAGVRGEITPRLVSTLRLGYEKREPKHGEVGSYSGFVANGDVVWQATERTRISLATERSVQESVFATNVAYLANLVTLSAEHFFTPKLLVSGRLFGGFGDYFEKAQKVNGGFDWREDKLFAYTVGVEYQIQKWLAVSADYTHSRRNSNFDNFDYKDDIVGGKVTLSF